MPRPTRHYMAIAAETLLIVSNTAQLLMLISFFWGGQASDAVYIYANVFQAALGSVLFLLLGAYWLIQEEAFATYCHLIPLSMHVITHLFAFTFANYAIASTHTIGSLLATLGFMMGMSFASININLTYLHNA